MSQVRPGAIRGALPVNAPERGESFDRIFADFEKILIPGITHWNHPGFFAYFATSGSGPGVLAEFLSAALNVQAMLWRTSPAATELEEVTLAWLRRLLGLPEAFEGRHLRHGLDLDTARAGGRTRAGRHRCSGAGTRGQVRSASAARLLLRARAFVGRQGGHPSRAWTRLRCAASKRMTSSACARTRLRRPSTKTRAPAPSRWPSSRPSERRRQRALTRLGPSPRSAERERLWLHVDAAYAGVAAIVPEHRWILADAAIAPTRWSSIRISGCSHRST